MSRGLRRAQGLVADAELLGGSGRVRLDHDVGTPREREKRVAVTAVAEVEHGRPLAAVPHAVPLGLLERRAVGWLDADHVGAVIGEHHRGHGTGGPPRQVEHEQAVEHTHGDPLVPKSTLLPVPPEPTRRLARMCGIAGFAGSDPELLDRMLRSIVHRGPDGAGVDIGPHFSIGMRRLAIIDVATGDQPLFSDDRNLALVFNGEIYNHEELRRAARSQGPPVRHRPLRHRSDPARLRGMGARGRRPPRRDVRVRDHGPREGRALPRPRPARHQAALLRRRPGRARVRVGAQGAVPGHASVATAQPGGAATLPALPRARRRRRHVLRRRAAPVARAHDAGAPRRDREDRALLEPAGEHRVRVEPQRRLLRAGVRRSLRPRGRPPPHLRRAGGRPALGRARLERRRRDDGAPHAARHRPAHRRPVLVLRAVSRADHRRERVHPPGRA